MYEATQLISTLSDKQMSHRICRDKRVYSFEECSDGDGDVFYEMVLNDNYMFDDLSRYETYESVVDAYFDLMNNVELRTMEDY